MRLAIVGCGHIAQVYARDLATYDTLEIVAATDLVPSRAEQLVAAFGGTAYPDLNTLLSDSSAEAIVNLTIHAAHAAVTRRGLDAARHVYSEKPLALDPAEARALVEQAEAHGLKLGCAPISVMGDAQRHAARLLRDGRCGPIRMVYAICNLGRLTEWNANPEPFLRIGPLFDGAVYPLTLLTHLFGPVQRVASAHQSLLLDTHEHDGRHFSVDTPDHTIAVLEFADGVQAHLTASMYVPYQTKHFNSLEFHGDDGSLFLRNAGDTTSADAEAVQFARLGQGYRPVPLPHPLQPRGYAAGIEDLRQAVASDRAPRASGCHAAHIVALIRAIQQSAQENAPVPVDALGFTAAPSSSPDASHPSNPEGPTSNSEPATLNSNRPALPPIGFGCSRYRGGSTYVDLRPAIETALDMGVRLLDGAELYGNERQMGQLLQQPGRPDREHLFLISKVWHTNHEPDRLIAACRQSREALQVDTLDAYLLHGPQAWAYTEPLTDLRTRSHDAATALTFPTNEDGQIRTAEVDLATTWRAMESLVERGWTRAIGVCNFDRRQLADLLDIASIAPALNQIECHPYHPRTELVDWCHDRQIAIMAHSPLSAPGLLEDPTLQQIAKRHDASTAQVILRWLIQRDIVPIPSSTQPTHIQQNLDVFGFHLSDEDRAAIRTLHQPEFSR